MTNTFDDELVATTAEFLTTFAETVTYYPIGGGSREISVIVERDEPAKLEGAPHGVSHKAVIQVANDATTGISSDEVNTKKDQVELAVRIGQAVQKRLISKILDQDAGMMRLEII